MATDQERAYYAERSRKYYAKYPEKAKAIQAKYYAANTEKVKARARRYRIENLEKVKAAQAQRRAANPEKVKVLARKYALKSAYGITPEQFMTLLEAQGGGCAICATKTPGGNGTFHVDHDHSTDKLRGLLCNHCNRGIGCFKDNPESLIMASAYLKRTGASSGVCVLS